MPKYAIKGLKTFKAHEGMPGYSCTLMIDGKAACDIFEDCCGGGIQYTWLDLNGRKLEEELNVYCKTLPPYKSEEYPDDDPLDMNADLFIEELVNDLLNAKEDASKAKSFLKKTCVKLPTDPKGSWSVWKLPPTPENKAKIRAKHPHSVFLDEHPNDWRKIVESD